MGMVQDYLVDCPYTWMFTGAFLNLFSVNVCLCVYACHAKTGMYKKHMEYDAKQIITETRTFKNTLTSHTDL